VAEVINTFEGGTPATTITTGNSGGASGNAFQFVQIVAGGSVTYNATAFRGALSGQFASGGTVGTCYCEYTTSVGAASSGQLFCRLRFRLPSLPSDSTGVRIIIVGDSTGSFRAEIRVTSAGAVSIRGPAGTALATFSATYVAGDWWDVGLGVLVFSSTVGQIQGLQYAADGSITQTITSLANQDTVGAGGTNKCQAGMLRSIANHTVQLDGLAWSTTAYPVFDTTGSAASTLPAATSAAEGTAAATGTAASALPPAESSATGTAATIGASAADLPAAVSAAEGTTLAAGVGAAVLPAAVAAGTGGPRDRYVTRPNEGVVTRPSAGTVTRPNSGVVTRP